MGYDVEAGLAVWEVVVLYEILGFGEGDELVGVRFGGGGEVGVVVCEEAEFGGLEFVGEG